MSKDMDIAAIQHWLATEGGRYADQHYRFQFPKTLLECLAAFKPMCTRFSNRAPEEGVTIEFSWDAAHGGQHDLIVGPPTMEMPKTGMIGLSGGWNEFRQPIKPGAYVFCRG